MPKASEKTLARNAARAAAGEIELDKLGRKKSGPQMGGEEELQTHTDVETGVKTEVWRRVPRDEVRCRAMITSPHSEWQGNQCTKVRNRGTVVCNHHGGNLPTVKKAAARRLAMAADPAAQKLIYIALSKPGVADKDRIRALVEILDRAGIAGKTTIELEVKPWQKILQNVYEELDGKPASETIELEEGVDYVVLDEDTDD